MPESIEGNSLPPEKIESTPEELKVSEPNSEKQILDLEKERKEIFTISNFLVEPKNNYADLISKAEKESKLERWGKRELFTPYASDLESALRGMLGYEKISDKKCEEERQEVISYLREKLSGKILVDLGCGAYSSMQNLAKELGVKVIVEVDKFFPEDEKIPLDSSVDLSFGEKNGDTQVVTIKSDILDFLSRLPNESVCIVINGIDNDLIKDEEYHRALVREFSRVIPEKNIVFGRNSASLGLISRKGSKDMSEEEKIATESFDSVRPEFLSGKWGIYANVFEKKRRK